MGLSIEKAGRRGSIKTTVSDLGMVTTRIRNLELDRIRRSVAVKDLVEKRNRRSVWTVPTQPFRGAHFATFPEKLVLPCLLAGTKAGDIVLDPFAGAWLIAE